MVASASLSTPQGNPWIVDFNGNIWRAVNGSFQQMPGLATDIGIGANGAVWITGTNSQNGSWEVWQWTGSSWIPDPGSGMEIDVTASGEPVVTGSDGKIWIKDGGANQGWDQTIVGGPAAFDVGLSPCFAPGQTLGGSALWFTTPLNSSLVFSFAGSQGLVGPYSTSPFGFGMAPFLNGANQVTASHIAVDTQGRVWAVVNPTNCDCAGELVERPFN